MDKSISLVISCFNEEGNINKLVERCEKILKIQNSELILVNNGSVDDTINIISRFKSLRFVKKITFDRIRIK